MKFPGSIKQWAGYSIYSAVVTMGLLYALFPSELFSRYAADWLAAVAEQDTKIGHVKPLLPVGVRAEDVELFSRERQKQRTLFLDELLLRPHLLSSLSGTPAVKISGDVYGGTMEGKIRFIDFTENSVDADIGFRKIEVEKYTYLLDLFGNELRGLLDADVTYEGPYAKLKGKGTAQLTFHSLSADISLPVMRIDSLELDKAHLNLEFEEGKITSSSLEIFDNAFKGRLEGTITLAGSLLESRVDMRGKVSVTPDFYKENPKSAAVVRAILKRKKDKMLSVSLKGAVTKTTLRVN